MIREVEFMNWQCYRGKHIIKLQPKAYAITARYEIDPGRSNMGGKSAIPEAIHFAMTGDLAKFRKFDANGWITDGEKSGYVQLLLEDGAVMRRERTRGSRTDVTFTPPKGKPATQADAESAFYKHVGFSGEDSKTIVYFEQDMMNLIVRTEPEARFDVIRGWLGLQKGEQAEDAATEIVKKRIREVTKLRARRESLMAMMPVETKHTPTLAELEAEKVTVAAELAALIETRDAAHALVEDKQLVERYDALVVEGKTASDEVDEISADLEERLESTENYVAEQQSAYLTAKQEAATKKKTSLGQFDGKCPVADIVCPATKRINNDRELSSSFYETAKTKEERAEKAWQTAKTGAQGVREEARDAVLKRAKLEQLRARASEMLESVREARKRVKAAAKKKYDLDEIDEQIEALEARENAARQALAEHHASVKQFASLNEQLETVEKDLLIEEKLAATATVGRTTFRAAQRRVAERALDTIGDNANTMLRTAGVDLNIRVVWEHEGKGYAKSCEMCGAAFPSSTKVKRCETCDAERGQNISQRLQFVLSERSGAADDFSGLAMQLAAGSYLLNLRKSSWAMAMIDEPFAKMDRTIRRAAAKQLLQLVGGGVYRQLMVISHSQDTVDLYPARINIVVARDGTRSIEVT